MKKKILHLISGLNIGGTEMMLLKTLPLLNDFEHIICSLSKKGNIGKKLEKLNFKVFVLGGGKLFSPFAILRFRKIIKNEKPDILTTYLIHADIFGRMFGRIFGIKKIVCSLRSTLGEPKYYPYLLIDRLTSFLVTKYIIVSQSIENFYTKKLKISKKKIVVIHNGVDLKDFEILIDKEEKKKSLDLENFNPIIGYVSKLRAEKGHPYLIEAFSSILKKYPKAALVLVGDGPEKEKLKKLCQNFKIEKNVFFLGNRSDVPEILKILDIFASPSLYEGLSNAILEAMAAKIAIVASNIPENRELIENEKEGFLVSIKNPKEMTEKILEILKNFNLKKELENSAFEKVTQKFEIKKTVQKLNDSLKEILEN